MEQQVQQLAGGVAVIKETLFGSVSSSARPASPSHPSPPGPASPTRSADAPGALLASHGMHTTALLLHLALLCSLPLECCVCQASCIAVLCQCCLVLCYPGWKLLLDPAALLCCAVLCCAVLCCAVLCCAVLCCPVFCCAELLLGSEPCTVSNARPQATTNRRHDRSLCTTRIPVQWCAVICWGLQLLSARA